MILKILDFFCLIMCIVNMVFSFIDQDVSATCGWIVAVIYILKNFQKD